MGSKSSARSPATAAIPTRSSRCVRRAASSPPGPCTPTSRGARRHHQFGLPVGKSGPLARLCERNRLYLDQLTRVTEDPDAK
jgi:hypothetical protein